MDFFPADGTSVPERSTDCAVVDVHSAAVPALWSYFANGVGTPLLLRLKFVAGTSSDRRGEFRLSQPSGKVAVAAAMEKGKESPRRKYTVRRARSKELF